MIRKAVLRRALILTTLFLFSFFMGVYFSPSIRYVKNRILFKLHLHASTHPDYLYSNRRESLFDVLKGDKPVLIAGDSRIDEVEWHELLERSDVANRGVGGDTIAGLTKRIIGYINTNTVVCVLQVGFNDILQGNDPERAFQDYVNLLNLLELQNIRIVVMAIIHAGVGHAYLNPAIIALNGKLSRYAMEYRHDWLDLNSELCDKSASLKRAYTIDGIHLSGMAYSIISPRINEVINAINPFDYTQ